MSSDTNPIHSVQVHPGLEESPASQSLVLRSLFQQRGSFGSVDDATLEQLAEKMVPRYFHDGEIIGTEGDPDDWAFVVTFGEVEVYKKARDGARIQVNVLKPGNWGGLMSLFNNAPRSAHLMARGEVKLRVLAHQDLADLLHAKPCLAMGLLSCMSQRLAEDAIHLAATLQYVGESGLEEFYACCLPEERLMLDTIQHRVAAEESLSKIMEFLFESFCQVGDCDRLTLAFLQDNGSRAASYWSRTTYEPLLLPADYQEDMSGTVMEESLILGRPRILSDLKQFSQEHPENPIASLLVREGIRSSIISPLIVGGRAVGFLILRARKRNAYNEHQVQLHRAIVQSISQTVEKAYRIEQLTQANSAYAEMLAFVSHELQSPIASMVMDSQLLVEGYLGELNEKQREQLQKTVRKGKYLLTLIRDYLNLARVEDSSLQAQMLPDVELRSQVVESAIDMIEDDCRTRNITIDRSYEDPALVAECDLSLMQIAIGNLLRNAVKYGRDGGTIRVIIKTEGEHARLTVWNEGPGFDPSQKTNLFQKFSRIDDPELKAKRGTGVGLYSTWRIMQLHRGRVEARSEKGAWAEFSLIFPFRSNA
ncbi:MAG: cyclic nucleotide-binding domain-containing protein [Pirellulales bacterium]|nr:cyclic nucleotide-binding domain-containing protein [Pirellulales bacterium]